MRRVIGLIVLLGAIWLIWSMTSGTLDKMLVETGLGNIVKELPIKKGDPATSSKILAEARKYDNEPYKVPGGHGENYEMGSGLDCSGLVVRAVLDATGTYDNRLADQFQNSPNWKKVPIAETREGDLVVTIKTARGLPDDHVAFVVSNGGDGNLSVFEAWTSKVAGPEQVRQTDSQPYNRWDHALRWVG